MAMNQLKSELDTGALTVRAPGAPTHGPVLSGGRVDHLLARPLGEPESTTEAYPPSMHGIWLGALAGTACWLAVAALLLLFF